MGATKRKEKKHDKAVDGDLMTRHVIWMFFQCVSTSCLFIVFIQRLWFTQLTAFHSGVAQLLFAPRFGCDLRSFAWRSTASAESHELSFSLRNQKSLPSGFSAISCKNVFLPIFLSFCFPPKEELQNVFFQGRSQPRHPRRPRRPRDGARDRCYRRGPCDGTRGHGA